MNKSSNLSTSHWAHTWWRHCKDLSTFRLRSESQNRRSFARSDCNRTLRNIITPQRGSRRRMQGALSPLPTPSLHGDNPHKNEAEELAWKMDWWRLVLESKKYHIWLISNEQCEKVPAFLLANRTFAHAHNCTYHNNASQWRTPAHCINGRLALLFAQTLWRDAR